jgi:hypothetical protein
VESRTRKSLFGGFRHAKINYTSCLGSSQVFYVVEPRHKLIGFAASMPLVASF